MRFTGKYWSETALYRLRECVGDGLSGGQIAAMFGVTRNAIIGKINRIRLETGDDTMRAGFSAGRIAVRKGHGTYKQKQSGWDRWKGRTDRGSSAIELAERRAKIRRKEEGRLAMLDLSDFPNRVPFPRDDYTKCPWPLWDDETPVLDRQCCGNRIQDGSFNCAAHSALAHDSRVAGTFVTDKARTANKWTTNTVRRDVSWKNNKPDWMIKADGRAA